MKTTKRLRRSSLDVTLPALIVLVGAALPWGRSGRRDRSSFQLVQVADRLEVLEGAAAVVARAWLLLPLAVAAIAVAGFAGRRRMAGIVGTVVSGLAVVLAIAVVLSPLQPRFGLHVTLVGAALLGLAGIGATTGMGGDAADGGSHETRKTRAPRT